MFPRREKQISFSIIKLRCNILEFKTFFSIIPDAFIDAAGIILGNIIGIDTKTLRKILEKKNYDEAENNLLQSFDIIQEKLMESQEIIENTLKEVSEQKKVFAKMSSDAEICKNMLELNKKQFESIQNLIEKPIKNEGKKSTIYAIAFGALFCIIGVLLGYVVAQI